MKIYTEEYKNTNDVTVYYVPKHNTSYFSIKFGYEGPSTTVSAAFTKAPFTKIDESNVRQQSHEFGKNELQRLKEMVDAALLEVNKQFE